MPEICPVGAVVVNFPSLVILLLWLEGRENFS